MKPYVELDCDNVEAISSGIYDFIKNKTDVLTSGKSGWIFLDSKQLILHVPQLMEFFKKYKLYVNDSAITLINENFPLHVDPKPVIAKINFPVINTKGWINCWYEIADEEFATLPTYTTQFGHITEDISNIELKTLKLIAEYHDMVNPIVFNSRLAHSVIKNNPQELPRIIASFTFHNEPLELLR